MWDYITERVIAEAEYIAASGATVRAAAAHFNISKSTVHKDVSERLRAIDPILFSEVKEVLAKNLSERHIRGGMATKCKYEHIKQRS
ncbi:MAG: sporulation transcriptional regulator SpoIIID [Candidatus Coproplasma sp.]